MWLCRESHIYLRRSAGSSHAGSACHCLGAQAWCGKSRPQVLRAHLKEALVTSGMGRSSLRPVGFVKPRTEKLVNEQQPDGPLGPFQGIWEAWEEVRPDIAAKPLSHFRRAIEIQFDELDQHLARADRDAAAREVIDMISIALNTMRWLDYNPVEIAEIAKARAQQRMKGQTRSILDKYEDRYGILNSWVPQVWNSG